MSSSMSPQPPTAEACHTASNPTTRNPEENAVAHKSESSAAARDAVLGRTPFPQSQSQTTDDDDDDAVPNALGQGVHSSGPVDATEKRNTGSTNSNSKSGANDRPAGPENPNVEAEQMEPPAEGKVADAVDRKSGAQKAPGQAQGHVQFDDYAGRLERKKEEQRQAREAVKEARREGVDVDGGFANRDWREDNRDV